MPGEIIFEFHPLGKTIKVSAVDVETGTEVSVMGPRSASQRDLERAAEAKLRYRLNKVSRPDSGPPGSKLV